MGASWLRRQTLAPAGYASGGGDTGFDRIPNPTTFGVILADTSTVKYVDIPKGALIIAGLNVPMPPANGDSFVVASSGTVSIGLTDGGTEFLNAATAANYTRTAYANGYPVTADTRIYFKPATAIVGATRACIEVIMPRITR